MKQDNDFKCKIISQNESFGLDAKTPLKSLFIKTI